MAVLRDEGQVPNESAHLFKAFWSMCSQTQYLAMEVVCQLLGYASAPCEESIARPCLQQDLVHNLAIPMNEVQVTCGHTSMV